MLLDVMGLKGDKYSRFLQDVQKHIPATNANGFMDVSGKWYGADDPDIPQNMKQWINNYKYVQYRTLFD